MKKPQLSYFKKATGAAFYALYAGCILMLVLQP